MSIYRCYLFDDDEHTICPPHEIDAPDRDTAIRRSGAICASNPQCAFGEVWLLTERISRVEAAALRTAY